MENKNLKQFLLEYNKGTSGKSFKELIEFVLKYGKPLINTFQSLIEEAEEQYEKDLVDSIDGGATKMLMDLNDLMDVIEQKEKPGKTKPLPKRRKK